MAQGKWERIGSIIEATMFAAAVVTMLGIGAMLFAILLS